MKKRRGLNRYYRKLHKLNVSEDWIEALSDNESWFNLAHEHFDWLGYGNISWRSIRNIWMRYSGTFQLWKSG